MHPSRRCTVCETLFTPCSYRSHACSPQCQRKADKARARGRSYERGECDVSTDTLAILLRLREAEIAIAEYARERADADIDVADLASPRELELMGEAQEREWMGRFRELDAQRQWKPIWVTAKPPGLRRTFTFTPPPRPPKGQPHALCE